MSFGLTRVRVRGFRSARDVEFAPRALCALVGEAMAGKSNLLAAIHALLEPEAALLRPDDATGADGRIRIEGDLASGRSLAFEAAPPGLPDVRLEDAPPALFLPATVRSGELIATGKPRGWARRAAELLSAAVGETVAGRVDGGSAAAPAVALLAGIEACCAGDLAGIVLLVEEPELYLRPQAQRYLYRLLRAFAEAGNQVVYSTHSPAFLNVSRLEELAIVYHDSRAGTQVVQPEPLPESEELRALSEFDAERSELFLARAAILVEGLTEKLVFPFVFQALGYDADREGISIVECGGKPNIPLFATVCNAARVPYVVVHDRDARPGKEPIQAERALNALIAEIAGHERTIILEPDFEAVAGLSGHRHKPQRALLLFSAAARSQLPEPLARAVELAVSVARGR